MFRKEFGAFRNSIKPLERPLALIGTVWCIRKEIGAFRNTIKPLVRPMALIGTVWRIRKEIGAFRSSIKPLERPLVLIGTVWCFKRLEHLGEAKNFQVMFKIYFEVIVVFLVFFAAKLTSVIPGQEHFNII